jgi:hypothetical protein
LRRRQLGKPLYIHAVRYGARTSIGKVSAATPIPPTLDYNLWCGPAPMKPLMRQNLLYDCTGLGHRQW